MCVHLFGASSSPGCASFALKKIASQHEPMYGHIVKEFIHRNFYVDNGLKSVQTVREAIALIDKARQLCAEGGVRLHKFASNSKAVISSVPAEEQVKGREHVYGQQYGQNKPHYPINPLPTTVLFCRITWANCGGNVT